MTEFVKFLARRELVTTGLSQFNNRPESFRAWQSLFLNTTKYLDISPSEELDLLTKWLGKESGHYVNRICLMHVNNPQIALRKDKYFPTIVNKLLIDSILCNVPLKINQRWKNSLSLS